MERKLRVLHITLDNKFFDSVFSIWEKEEDIENKAICIVPCSNYKFEYVKSTEKVELLWSKEMVKECLGRNDYDVVFFHSLIVEFYSLVSFIPIDRTIIWWGWGIDIYGTRKGMHPLINLPLYKPLTEKYIFHFNWSFKGILCRLYWSLVRSVWEKKRNEVLNRIDYFQPVLMKEFRMICQNEHFRAKEFYYKSIGYSYKDAFVKSPSGNIVLGNSATATNNHLDVLKKVLSCKQESQKIIMPLNYGSVHYKKWLTPQIQNPDIIPLFDFLPRKEYFEIVKGCSYAVFGTLRQQAMGNISFALSKGIKVFLYKDSVAYQNHKALGYAVYAIEDMTRDSLLTPLSLEEIEQNHQAFLKERERRWAVFDTCIEEIKNKYLNNVTVP